MQVFGLPGHVVRKRWGGVASSRREDAHYRSGEKTRGRGALAAGDERRPDDRSGRARPRRSPLDALSLGERRLSPARGCPNALVGPNGRPRSAKPSRPRVPTIRCGARVARQDPAPAGLHRLDVHRWAHSKEAGRTAPSRRSRFSAAGRAGAVSGLPSPLATPGASPKAARPGRPANSSRSTGSSSTFAPTSPSSTSPPMTVSPNRPSAMSPARLQRMPPGRCSRRSSPLRPFPVKGVQVDGGSHVDAFAIASTTTNPIRPLAIERRQSISLTSARRPPRLII
jgi:hypothetical protein